MNNERTHIDLFSGIGGFALAAGWAGFRTVAFCEIDPFCQEVLKERFGAVADAAGNRWAESTPGRMEEAVWLRSRGSNREIRPIIFPDIRALDGSRFRGATLLTGGFPCQPFSVAGKRKGKDDTRHLWPEMLRVISEARPAWVVGENVAGIVNMELEQVCLDLEGEGYEVQPVIVPACAVNAPHRRDRVWIIAHSTSNGSIGQDVDANAGGGRIAPLADCPSRDSIGPRADARSAPGRSRDSVGESDRHAPDAETAGLLPRRETRSEVKEGDARRGRFADNAWDTPWPEVAARLCGIHDGLPAEFHQRRTERLKALGNSIVPQVAFEIISRIP